MFVVKEFPGRVFETWREYEEARNSRQKVEEALEEKREKLIEPLRITAQIVPVSPDDLERRVNSLEKRVKNLEENQAQSSPKKELAKRPPIGTILRGETRGQLFTLEVLPDGYLCSNGQIYDSLSGAALDVSGNRRSGWKFWKNAAGTPVGESTGRFKTT